jgi:hypothetical protein
MLIHMLYDIDNDKLIDLDFWNIYLQHITLVDVSSKPCDLIQVGLWFMVINSTFNNISAILYSQFDCWRKEKCPEKSTDLLQVTD